MLPLPFSTPPLSSSFLPFPLPVTFHLPHLPIFPFRYPFRLTSPPLPLKDASLVLQTTQSVLSTHLANLAMQPFMNAEVALRMLYLVGEAITDKV